jgi:hypothetical protein
MSEFYTGPEDFNVRRCQLLNKIRLLKKKFPGVIIVENFDNLSNDELELLYLNKLLEIL